jgi:NAD+ kinase
MSGSPRAGNGARPDHPASRLAAQVRHVAILGSPSKPLAAELLERVSRWMSERAVVVYSDISFDSQKALAARPDLLVVLGGDGTLIGAVHGLRDRQIPIVGVNLGKLGYMADFTLEELEREGDFLFSGSLPITRRTLMDVRIERHDGFALHTPAVNDCVVLAGAPFHMIELSVEVDGDRVAVVRGDGLIVATPSGSTAHNLAAGGPIVEPTGEAVILTPICPHALTYRPIVLDARRRILLKTHQANEGTTASVDGRITSAFAQGDRIVITRYPADFLLVRNPRRSEWHALRRKLRWGEGPNMH